MNIDFVFLSVPFWSVSCSCNFIRFFLCFQGLIGMVNPYFCKYTVGGTCFYWFPTFIATFFSNENKQPSLKLCCLHLGGEQMAERHWSVSKMADRAAAPSFLEAPPRKHQVIERYFQGKKDYHFKKRLSPNFVSNILLLVKLQMS